MFVFIVYDVDARKDPKVLKILRKTLFHVQKSVFEGNVTSAQFKALKEELNTLNYQENEQVLIYKMFSEKEVLKETIGKEESCETIL